MESGIRFELRWPLVVTTLSRPPSEAAFERYLRELTEQVICAHRPHAHLIIMENGASYGPGARAQHVQWQRDHRDEFARYCAATALVMPEISGFMRFALSTLLAMIGDAASPTKLFTGEAEARAWLEQMLAHEAA